MKETVNSVLVGAMILRILAEFVFHGNEKKSVCIILSESVRNRIMDFRENPLNIFLYFCWRG